MKEPTPFAVTMSIRLALLEALPLEDRTPARIDGDAGSFAAGFAFGFKGRKFYLTVAAADLDQPESQWAFPSTQHPECSICRRRHGPEVEHACE